MDGRVGRVREPRARRGAYSQDQLPTKHPIVADIVDLEAAKLNFDGITYAKGASVLKQWWRTSAGMHSSKEARRYFRKHEFGKHHPRGPAVGVVGGVRSRPRSMGAGMAPDDRGSPR